jgi:hypothetical protein
MSVAGGSRWPVAQHQHHCSGVSILWHLRMRMDQTVHMIFAEANAQAHGKRVLRT